MMQDEKIVVDFDAAKEKHVHVKREEKIKSIRNAFKKARQAVLTPAEKAHEKKLEKRMEKKRQKKAKKGKK